MGGGDDGAGAVDAEGVEVDDDGGDELLAHGPVVGVRFVVGGVPVDEDDAVGSLLGLEHATAFTLDGCLGFDVAVAVG